MPMATTHTFGDLIRQHRANAKLSLNDLASITRIGKGTISKIENGEVRKPEFRTIKTLASALHIPYKDYIEMYVDLERNPETLLLLLEDAIANDNSVPIITKIATKFLESEREDSFDSTNRLFNTTCALDSTPIKLVLFKVIIKYSRSHGVMPFLAKSLYQEYIIERDDFSQLQATFQSGRYILNYTDLLSAHERIHLYYGLAVHSYTLRLYEDSLFFCNLLLDDEESEVVASHLKIHAYGILRGSYYYLGDYEKSRKCADYYKGQGLPYVADNDRLFTALLTAKSGDIELTLAQFEECLQKCNDDYTVYVVNKYISYYFEIGHVEPIKDLLKFEDKINNCSDMTPLARWERACFQKLKGDYYASTNEIDQAVNSYINSAFAYSQINDIDCERSSLRLVFELYKKFNQRLSEHTIDKIAGYYSSFEK